MIHAPTKPRTNAARIREWVTARVEGLPEFRSEDVVDATLDHFSSDRAFVNAFLRENLRPLIYQIVQRSFKDTHAPLSDGYVALEALEAGAQGLKSRWTNWVEHAGDRHVRFLDMRRSDLDLAARERRTRASTEIQIARFFDLVAARLPNNDATIGQVFTLDEVEGLYRQLQGAA